MRMRRGWDFPNPPHTSIYLSNQVCPTFETDETYPTCETDPTYETYSTYLMNSISR